MPPNLQIPRFDAEKNRKYVIKILDSYVDSKR